MAVIVSDSRNSSYDGKLSTANNFYRAEAYNMTAEGGTLSLSTTRNIAVTFLNAGNFQGIALALQNSTDWYFPRTITVALQENVASVWTTRVSETRTPAQIVSSYGVKYDNTDNPWFGGFIPFKFTTPYAVDTTANKWRFQISQSASTYTSYTLRTSDGTNPSFVAWCDNKVTYSDTNDAVVFVDKVYIDQNFNPKPYTGTGDTTFGVTSILCTDPNYADPFKLIVRNSDLSSSLTWTMDGITYISTGSGIQIGSKTTSPISYANRFNILFKRVTSLGHSSDNVYWTNGVKYLGNKGNNYLCDNASIELAGEIPTLTQTTLSADANTGQANIVVTDDPSSWVAGDRLVIGRCDGKSRTTDSWKFYTISSISGNTITLTTNIAEKRWAGGAVINLDAKYGIRIYSNDITKGPVNNIWLTMNRPYIYNWSGVTQQGVGVQMGIASNSGTRVDDPTYATELKVEDCTFSSDITNGVDNNNRFGFQGVSPNIYGFKFRRIAVHNITCFTGIIEGPNLTRKNSATVANYAKLGRIIIEDCSQLVASFQTFTSYLGAQISFLNCNFSNMQYCPFNIYGNNFIANYNKIWGNGTSTSGGTGAVTFGVTGNVESFQYNEFDNNTCALMVANTASFSVLKHNSFGQTKANSEDVGISSGIGLSQVVLQETTGNLTLQLDARSFMSPFGYLRFANWNNVEGDNREYQQYGEIFSTGTGLSDTTSHNSGYAMRFSSSLSGQVVFTQKIPTGNIQNKDMMVGVWVKINSANYWAGTHQMPRLTITYDETTTAYAEAGQTTDWQFLFVPFTPSTTAGLIDVKFTTDTDGTGSNSYVYFDDMSVLYPAGYNLNLGNMDLWFEGSPVTPMISTTISAQDVWSADPAQFGADTVGDKVNKIKNDTGIIPALL